MRADLGFMTLIYTRVIGHLRGAPLSLKKIKQARIMKALIPVACLVIEGKRTRTKRRHALALRGRFGPEDIESRKCLGGRGNDPSLAGG